MAVTAALDPTRLRLAIYASTTLAGIVMSVVSDQTLGAVVTVGSITMLIWTLHKFGRSGPE